MSAASASVAALALLATAALALAAGAPPYDEAGPRQGDVHLEAAAEPPAWAPGWRPPALPYAHALSAAVLSVPAEAGSVADGQNGLDKLGGASGSAALAMGSPLLAVAASEAGDGALPARVHGNGTLGAAGPLGDDGSDNPKLDGAGGRDAAASFAGRADGGPAVPGLPHPGGPGSPGRSQDIADDATPPSVQRVYSPDPDGVYGTGRIVAIAVVFDEEVAVAEGEDAPLIRLATDPPRDAVYSGRGNGTAELEFWYTVQPGDAAADLGYAGPAALSMGGSGGGSSGAAIRDLAGNAASTPLPAPGSPGSLSASGDIQVHGDALPVLAAARSAAHSGAFPELDQPYSVAAFELGDRNETYALAAGYDGDGVQLVRIDERGRLSAAYSLDRNRNALELNGAIDVDVIDLGVNATFAVVASFWDDNIPLLRIPEHGQLWPTGGIDDLDDGALELNGPLSIDAFRTAGGTAFALVASRYDNGIQLLRIGYTIEAADSLDMTDNGGLPLEDAGGVAAFRTANGTTLALVASFGSSGIQLVRVNENGTLAAVSSATSADAGFARLDRASFVSTIRAPDGGNSTLAMVTPSSGGHMQLIRVHDNGTLEPEGSAADGQNGFDTLGRPQNTDFFEMSGRTYSIVAARVDDGVQLVRVREDATLEAAGSAVDGRDGFARLDGARGIDVFETAGGRMYAVVASKDDSGLQTIRLSPPSAAGVSASLSNGTYPAGHRLNVTVDFDEPVVVSGPPPQLSLALDGGRTVAAEYVSGSGTNLLVFGYEVRPGDSTVAAAVDNGGTLEYAGPAALATRGTVTDLRAAGGAAGKAAAADLELPAPGGPGSLGAHGIRIDGRVPLVRDVSFLSASGTYTAGSALHIAVRFDKDVLVSGTPQLALSTTPPASAAYASGNGSDTLVFVYTVRDGDAAAGGLAYAGRTALSADADRGASIRDRIGNDAGLALPDPGSLVPSGIIIDARAPSILDAYALNASGTYAAGSALHVAVRLDEAVLVSGTPQLALSTTPPASAAYASGGGSDELVFVYTVRDGDAADGLGYAGQTALSAGGGAIRDAAGNDADLRLPPPDGQGLLGAAGRIRIDAVAPRVVSVSSPDADGTYGIGSTINVTAAFSEPVRVEGAPRMPLETGEGAVRHASYVPGSSSPATTLAFAYTVMPGDRTGDLDHGDGALIDLNGGSIRDEAGNGASLALPPAGSPGSLGGSKDIAIDAAGGRDPSPIPDAPAVVSVHVRSPAGPYTAGETIAIDVVFSAPVSVGASGGGGGVPAPVGAGTPYLELRTGSAGARAGYVSGGGTDAIRFEYAVRGGDLTDRLSYAGTDALRLNGSAITATGSGLDASVILPAPGAPGSLSAPGSPAVRIDPEPGRPVLDVGVLDDEGAGSAGGGVREAALAAAYAFNERQGRSPDALLLNATAYNASGAAAGPAAATALQAAHAGGTGPSVYVGPSTDRGLHAAMPYAADNGIVLASAGSTAPSLAVEDDWTFRFLPSGRLDAEALARLARTAGSESMVALLENATHGPPTAAGADLTDATPPPQGRFSRAFDAALDYVGPPTLSGPIILGGAAGGGVGPYEAAAAAEALDAAVQAARSTPDAVVYAGSPQGLAVLAAAAAPYPALASAAWIASGQSANSSLLAGEGPAAAFAAQAGLQAVRWSTPAGGQARAVDSLLPPGGASDTGARHRAYAAYDAMSVIGMAAAATDAAGQRGDTPDAAAVAEKLPDAAAAYDGALGDIALDPAGDLWVPAAYDLWTVTQPGGAGSAPEWTLQEGALDETRACSISLTRAKIDYGPIDSGQTSRPHLQTIVNTGQLSFSRVDLTSTPWHVDSPGNCEPGDTPSLPVGLSEIRTVAGGTFSDLAGTGTVLAQGLEAGSRSPLWYRLSLAGYADLPQAEIIQCATYVVRCG